MKERPSKFYEIDELSEELQSATLVEDEPELRPALRAFDHNQLFRCVRGTWYSFNPDNDMYWFMFVPGVSKKWTYIPGVSLSGGVNEIPDAFPTELLGQVPERSAGGDDR